MDYQTTYYLVILIYCDMLLGSMPFGKDDTGVSISRKRLNGLKFEAAVQRRTVKTQLDMILDKAGIKELSDEQFSAALKKAGLEFLEAKA